MGRGRQKAKDAKIARQLKYTNQNTDLRSLERELLSDGPSEPNEPAEDEYYDRWAPDAEDDAK